MVNTLLNTLRRSSFYILPTVWQLRHSSELISCLYINVCVQTWPFLLNMSNIPLWLAPCIIFLKWHTKPTETGTLKGKKTSFNKHENQQVNKIMFFWGFFLNDSFTVIVNKNTDWILVCFLFFLVGFFFPTRSIPCIDIQQHSTGTHCKHRPYMLLNAGRKLDNETLNLTVVSCVGLEFKGNCFYYYYFYHYYYYYYSYDTC